MDKIVRNFGAFIIGFCLAMMWGIYQAHSKDIITRSDGGGRIDALHQQYYSEWAGGRNRHVIDGYCGSACTLKLSFPNTCVTPRAKFMFHHGFLPLGFWELYSPWGSEYMMSYYPPKIKAWINAQGGLQYRKMWLSSADAVKLGVKAC